MGCPCRSDRDIAPKDMHTDRDKSLRAVVQASYEQSPMAEQP